MKPIDDLLSDMMARNASDLHIKAGSPPVIRVDGELLLLDEPPLTPEDTKDVAASIMTDKQIRRFSEHNEIDFAYSAPTLGRFRVNVFRQRGSISVAMRQVTTRIPSFEELHLPEIIKRLALEPRGLVLVTGTTGSGKTTTLAAMIDHINNTMRRHIVTVEDPIEVLHKDKKSIINQREIGLDTDSYASALKYVLRQDPDDILIGEMRDPETVAAALTAAQTGHFVMSTLHTIDATETINRVIDFYPPYQQQQARIMLAATLRGIISMRLLPAVGGGLVPAVEALVMTGTIREYILDPEQTHKIRDAMNEGEYYGMQTFDQSLYFLLGQGLITEDEALLWATNVGEFKLRLEGVMGSSDMAKSNMERGMSIAQGGGRESTGKPAPPVVKPAPGPPKAMPPMPDVKITLAR